MTGGLLGLISCVPFLLSSPFSVNQPWSSGGAEDRAGAVTLRADPIVKDEVAHHREVALRIAGVDALAVCRGFVLVDAVFGVGEYRDRDRFALGLEGTKAPYRLCAWCIVVIGGQNPELRRTKIAQHRHGVVIRRDARQ